MHENPYDDIFISFLSKAITQSANPTMRTVLIKILSLLFLVFLFIQNIFANGPIRAFTGATEFTQLANNAELVKQVSQQAEQIAHELQMINNMVTNTINIPNQIWSNAMSDLSALFNIVQQGQALAFSAANLGEIFKAKFPSFSKLTGRNYVKDYRNWTDSVRDSIRTSLEAANLQASQFMTEENTLSQLRLMFQTSTGRLQAIQVENQIAHEIATQIQKLRISILSQIQAQNAFMASQQSVQDTEEDGLRKFLNHPNRPVTFEAVREMRNKRGW